MGSKVLIPVDLGHAERTDGMLAHVKNLTESQDTKLILVHVVPEIPAYIAAQLPPGIGENSGKEAAEAMHKLAADHGIDSTAAVRIEYGNPANKILDVAREEAVDMIVIGSHQPGPADYLLGSVAGRVVRHATCSVLVVR